MIGLRPLIGGTNVLGVLVLAVSTAASVGDLRSTAQNNPDLLFQYSFEGDATQRLLDTGNGGQNRDLTEESGRGGGTVANIAYPQGFDSTTTAMRPEFVNEITGAALRANDDPNATDDNLFLPGTLTVEFLFTVDSATPNYGAPLEDDFAHAVNTRIWPLRRGYFLMQDEEGDLITNIGRRFNNPLGEREILNSSQINPGNWYYYAITLEAEDFENVDSIPDTEPGAVSTGSDTTVNAYLADLTAGQTTLTQVLTNEVLPGGFSGPKNTVSSGNIGIGMFEESETNNPGGGDKQFWDGSLDEVSFYGDVLTLAELQSHLDVLLSAAVVTGDYNANGLVEQGDLNQVLNNWGLSFDAVAAAWVNQRPTEGIVDQAELNAVLNNWGADAAPDLRGVAVPEPAAGLVCGLSALVLARRTRCRPGLANTPDTERRKRCRRISM